MNYFIEYEYLTDLVLDEVVEIQHSAEFIERILISTQPFENIEELGNDFERFKNILKIKFELSNQFDECKELEIKKFFSLKEEWDRKSVLGNGTSITGGAEINITNFLKKEVALMKSREVIDYIIHFIFFYSTDKHESKTEVISYSDGSQLSCTNKLDKLRFVFEVENNLPKKTKDVKFIGFYSKEIPLLFKPDLKKRYSCIKNKLKSIDWDNHYYSMLYSIMKNEKMDNISKYVILYSLLIEKFKTQNAADNKIEEFSEYRQTEDGKDQQGNPKKMTKITWLRNEIGHTSQKDFDLDRLRKEIDEHLNPLFRILKETLMKYVFDK